MNEQHLFMRGKLAGYRVDENKYMADGVQKIRKDHQVGIEKIIDNGFGQQTVFVTANIIASKLNDAAFMKSIQDNLGKIVEFSVFVGNYRTLLIGDDSVITVLAPQLKQAV